MTYDVTVAIRWVNWWLVGGGVWGGARQSTMEVLPVIPPQSMHCGIEDLRICSSTETWKGDLQELVLVQTVLTGRNI